VVALEKERRAYRKYNICNSIHVAFKQTSVIMLTEFANLELQPALQIILGVVDFERTDGDVASAQLDRLRKGGTIATKTNPKRPHWYSYTDHLPPRVQRLPFKALSSSPKKLSICDCVD